MSRKIAEERIERLFELADKSAEDGDFELADRYVELAKKIGMKYNVPIPRNLKKRMCDECNSYLVPGKNAEVRINSKNRTINYRCGNCGAVNRYGY